MLFKFKHLTEWEDSIIMVPVFVIVFAYNRFSRIGDDMPNINVFGTSWFQKEDEKEAKL